MSFPDTPCPTCPRVGRGLSMPCPAMATNHARFCELAAKGRPGYVALVCGESPPVPSAPFPPLLTQARNLAVALGRFIRSGGATTTPEERERRLSICHECPHFDPGPPGRCRLCGCVAKWAARIASKGCPDKPPRW